MAAPIVGQPDERTKAIPLTEACGASTTDQVQFCSGMPHSIVIANDRGVLASRGGVEFGVLGPLRAVVDGQPVPVPAVKHRALLGALLLRANQVVPVADLLEYVWAEASPAGARGALHTYVHRLRRAFGRPDLIVTHGDGYAINVPPVALDLHEFRALLEQADKAALDADPVAESGCLRAALALWRGRVLADVPSDALRGPAQALEEERLRVIERCVAAELAGGRHADLISELRGLVAEHPLRERFWQQLVLALSRSGRQADALEAYRAIDRKLRHELGIEPGTELRALHQAVLTGQVEPVPSAGRPTPRPAGRWNALCTLPLDLRMYVGRADVIARAERELNPRDASLVPMMAIWGPPGAGKTALAVRIAHHLRDRFPDGQWYVRLAGAGGLGRDPMDVLAELLQVSGLDAAALPDLLEARAALLRSRLAGRRVLLLLDDAADAAQVRPLLPGTAGPVVLVTSRADLRGLAALHDVRMVTLDVLPPQDAHTLLAELVPDVASESPDLMAELARLCGYLPLALRLAAANLIRRPRADVADYVRQMRAGDRLRYLAVAGDPQAAVRATFALSYEALPPPVQRLFRLLGVVPGGDFTRETVAALLGVAPPEAEDLLDHLAARSLVQQHRAGRHQLHDLLRMYAAERAAAEEPDAERLAALGRLFDHYLRAVDAAGATLYPDLVRLSRPVPDAATGIRFRTAADALSYLDTEAQNLAAVIAAAEDTLPAYAWHLADALRGYFHSHSTTEQWRAAVSAGLGAADRAGHLPAQAAMHLSLGTLFWHLSRYPEALDEMEQARIASHTAGLPAIEGAALSNLGVVRLELGHLAKAAELFREVLALPSASGQEFVTANALVNLGGTYLEMGDMAAAEDASARARDLCDRINSPHSGAVARANLGQVYRVLYRLEEAATLLGEAKAAFDDLRSAADTAEAMANLASVYRDAGRLDEALATANAAVAEARDLDVPRVAAETLVARGGVHLVREEYSAAAESFREALRLVGDGGQRRSATKARIGLAHTSRQLGDPAAGTVFARQALADAQEYGLGLQHGVALTALAFAELASGDLDAAERHAREAVEVHEGTGYVLGGRHARQALDEVAQARRQVPR
ncbi:AfsR/SARP family transcriptional regulator [Micromonospora sp. CPCC 206061]|uniref:AfsR/SARP family transcriptional regulator n=1 Tax=Micromonospora sp. CPCC 206061 TaxID=3122410 RepID=UPI002FF30B6B